MGGGGGGGGGVGGGFLVDFCSNELVVVAFFPLLDLDFRCLMIGCACP